jgi:chloramphenicol-sensitive protein RarD
LDVAADSARTRAGLFYALAAYGMWGIVPLYFKSLPANCPAKEMVAQRVLWSAIVLAIVLTALRRWPDFRAAFRSRRTLLMLFTSAYLVAANWLVYIYSTFKGEITQASLGYFILPLVNVVVGLLFFGERLRLAQAIALAIAAGGVVFMTVAQGKLPWIGLTLAFSFAFYGIVRKVVPVDGVVGLSVETVLLAPTAIVLIFIWERAGEMSFGHGNANGDMLIALSGIVTTMPLICFAQAVRRVSLVTIGVIQYLSPSLQLLVAVLFYKEEFTVNHQISFGLIWTGLAIYVVDVIRSVAKRKSSLAQEPVPEPLDGGVPLTESGLTDIRPVPRAP